MFAPAHHCGHIQTGVYLIFPSPRGRTHCVVVWPLSGIFAHCQSCGTAWMGSGILAGVDAQGSQGWEGQAQLALPSVVCFGREADLSEGWIHRSTALGVCAVQASSVNRFPLGFWLGDGRGRWRWPVPLFPAELSSVFQGSIPLLPNLLSPSCSLSRAVDL